jgi:hypothetical protein
MIKDPAKDVSCMDRLFSKLAKEFNRSVEIALKKDAKFNFLFLMCCLEIKTFVQCSVLSFHMYSPFFICTLISFQLYSTVFTQKWNATFSVVKILLKPLKIKQHTTLIKKKRKFPSNIRKFRGIGWHCLFNKNVLQSVQ